MRGGESPLAFFPLAFVLCPIGGGGPASGPAWPRQDVRKIFSNRPGGRPGLAHTPVPGFVAVLFFCFFFLFLFLSSFFWWRGPPSRRVTQASAIRLLSGWGKQAAARPGEEVGRFPASLVGPAAGNLLSGFPSSCPEALAPSPACSILPWPASQLVAGRRSRGPGAGWSSIRRGSRVGR